MDILAYFYVLRFCKDDKTDYGYFGIFLHFEVHWKTFWNFQTYAICVSVHGSVYAIISSCFRFLEHFCFDYIRMHVRLSVSEHDSCQTGLSIGLPFGENVISHCYKRVVFTFVHIRYRVWHLNHFVTRENR